MDSHQAAGAPSPDGRENRKATFGASEDWFGARDGHDHEDEDGLRVFHSVEIMNHRFPPFEYDDGNRQRNGPNPEHGFHFAQEMEEGCLERSWSRFRATLEASPALSSSFSSTSKRCS